jgi:cytochrome c-type biogenesis protein CcmE
MTRTRKPKRLRYGVAAFICVAAVGVLLIGGLSRNLVYFRTVSEAVKARDSTGTHRFRLAGAVKPGTVHQTAGGVTFVVTDGKAEAEVDHTGAPPELFKDGAPVVCEGRWGHGLLFRSDRILIKHGAEYTPPKVNVSAPAGQTS